MDRSTEDILRIIMEISVPDQAMPTPGIQGDGSGFIQNSIQVLLKILNHDVSAWCRKWISCVGVDGDVVSFVLNGRFGSLHHHF